MADSSSATGHSKGRKGISGLRKASVCVERGFGVWDVVPPRDPLQDKFEDALLRLKVESFFECLALCIHFIIGGDITFAQVEVELWDRHRDIEALGSALLGRRIAYLIYDVEVAVWWKKDESKICVLLLLQTEPNLPERREDARREEVRC